MQLIKSRIVSQQQLDGSETITITDSKLIRCQHGKYKLFVSHDDGSVKSLCIGEDGSFGKQRNWELGQNIIKIEPCSWGILAENHYCCVILALTGEGAVWRIQVSCVEDSGESNGTVLGKRPRSPPLHNCEQIFQHQTLTWFHCHDTGFLGVLEDLQTISYSAVNKSYKLVIGRPYIRSSVTVSADVSRKQIHPSLYKQLFQSESEMTVLLGLKDGSVIFRSIHGDTFKDQLITKLPGEDVRAIHFLKLEDQQNTLCDTIAVLGSLGTMMLYSVQSKEPGCLLYKEFYVPGSISASDVIGDNNIMAATKNDGEPCNLQLISFPCQTASDSEYFTITNTQLESPMVAMNIYAIKTFSQKEGSFLSIDFSSTVAMIEADISGPRVDVAEDEAVLQRAIEQTLNNLVQCERVKEAINKVNERLSDRLSSVNRMIHLIQRVKAHKRENGLSCLECHVQPVVSVKEQRAVCFLKLHIRTTVPLKWKNWQLHVDVWGARPQADEDFDIETDEERFTTGFTHTASLVHLSKDGSECEYEVPLNTYDRQLPLYVSMHLSTDALSDNSSEFVDLSTSCDTEGSRILYPLSDLILDELHFIVPCSQKVIEQIKRIGLPEETAALKREYREVKRAILSYDRDGLPITRDKRDIPFFNDMQLPDDYVSPKLSGDSCLSFKVSAEDYSSIDTTYRRILPSLLGEGKSTETLAEIIPEAERAYFTLAAYPESPVVLTLKRVNSTETRLLDVELKIQCQNENALLRTEASILMRLQDMLVEDESGPTNDNTDFFRDYQLLTEEVDKLEGLFRDREAGLDGNVRHKFWKPLADGIKNLRKYHRRMLLGTIKLPDETRTS